MDSTIKIEQITSFSPEVFDAIRNLAQQEGKNYKELTESDAKEMLAYTHMHIFVARDTLTSKIVGMGALVIHRIPYVKKATVEDVVVDKDFRGRGIGTELINTLTAKAKELGAAYVDFTARPRREDSNSLYEKLGFVKRETNVYRHIVDYGEV